VDLPRPRGRKALNHDPRFKEIRRSVMNFLLTSGAKPKTEVSRKLTLPDIEPEDLSMPRDSFSSRRRPIRRNEIKRETVAIGE
jgi:nitrate/nitrite transport system ATP-binding protein